MSRKLTLIFITVLSFLHFHSFSQCIPDTFIQPGIYPDTVANLDSAIIGVAYADILTAVIPKDTLVFGKHIPVDSIGIISFTGLPWGFTVEPNTLSGYWHGGGYGCVLISGMPYDSQIGIYPLHITVRASVGGLVSDYNVPGYKLILDYTTSISRVSDQTNSLHVYYTPAFQTVKLSFLTNTNGYSQITVFSSSGKQVYMSTIVSKSGNNIVEIPAGKMTEGLYIIRVVSGQKNYLAKFLKIN